MICQIGSDGSCTDFNTVGISETGPQVLPVATADMQRAIQPSAWEFACATDTGPCILVGLVEVVGIPLHQQG